MEQTLKIAEKFKIPIIIAGWTKGQSKTENIVLKPGCVADQPEFSLMSSATKNFLKELSQTEKKYKKFPQSIEEVLKRAKKKNKFMILSPHWFLPFDEETISQTIKEKLKWKAPQLSYPMGSTNCMLNFISSHLALKNHGYTHYHIEMSKLIREGLLTREEALKRLEINFSKELLNSVAKKLDHSF